MNVIDLKREWFRECEKNNPELYAKIVGTECSDDWGLPSYGNINSCPEHLCEQCWKEALGIKE